MSTRNTFPPELGDVLENFPDVTWLRHARF
jgi:hypothetical protein